MLVAWGSARIVDLPLETFRFDPDPFCVNEAMVRPRRVQMAIAELSQDTQPQGPVLNPEFKAHTPPPAITAFDVHGCPKRRQPERFDETIDLPPALLRFVAICGRLFGSCVGMFYLAVLAPRRERRRLMQEAR